MTPEIEWLTQIVQEAVALGRRDASLLDGRDFNAKSWDAREAALTRLAHICETQRNLLRRLRQWDMLVGGIGADGEHHEATADAPYWRQQLDAALALTDGEAE